MMYGNFTERELDAFWKGVESEEERIIKLLEEARTVFIEDSVSYGTMTGLIALIKGETK